jgi:hypothetical protein
MTCRVARPVTELINHGNGATTPARRQESLQLRKGGSEAIKEGERKHIKKKIALTSAAGDGLRRDNRDVINGIL